MMKDKKFKGNPLDTLRANLGHSETSCTQAYLNSFDGTANELTLDQWDFKNFLDDRLTDEQRNSLTSSAQLEAMYEEDVNTRGLAIAEAEDEIFRLNDE